MEIKIKLNGKTVSDDVPPTCCSSISFALMAA